MYFQLVFLCSSLSLIWAYDSRRCMTSEERLFDDLLHAYDTPYRHTRPVARHNDTITVSFGLSLININSFNEETGVGEFLFWDKYMWTDSRLTWDPDNYDGITSMRIPASLIWRPDITTYNSLWSKEEDHISDVMAVASSTGTVLYIPQHIRKLRCIENKKFASDDEFQCTIKVGSWTYDGFLLDPDFYNNLEKIDVTTFMGDASHILQNSAKKNVMHYPCCTEPYPNLEFSFTLSDLAVEPLDD